MSVTLPAPAIATCDLGSGTFRLLIAEMENGEIQVKYTNRIDTKLGIDLGTSSDQTLSEAVQQAALEALQTFKREAEERGATQIKGVATAVFRLARNGVEVLTRLKNETEIDLEIISQEEEGILGFHTAKALFPNISEENLVFWDMGGASFQIVVKHEGAYQVYEGPLGRSQVIKLFIEEIRKETFTKESTLNSITETECNQLVELLKEKISPPEWLTSKTSQRESVVVASSSSTTGEVVYSKKYFRDWISKIAENKAPETVLLRCAIMEKCNIEKVVLKENPAANALGLLFRAKLAESF